MKMFRNESCNDTVLTLSLYLWLLGWSDSKEEEMRQALADSIRSNIILFKNVYGTVSFNKIAQHILKKESFRDVSVMHFAFSIWQKKKIIFIGTLTFRYN